VTPSSARAEAPARPKAITDANKISDRLFIVATPSLPPTYPLARRPHMMSPEVKRLPIIAHIAIYAAIHRSQHVGC
jgi:hypothetical protein